VSNPPDRTHNIKFAAYCMSQLPPEGVETSFDDFVRYAKFQLCFDKHVLMEDSIWDKYTDEQILVEYYANLFSKSRDERTRFEDQLKGFDSDIYAWFDAQIKKNQEEMAEKAKGLEDKVKFVPETIGE
jgi:hypothetical protein